MNRLDREDKTKKLPASRSSRAITIIGLCSLAAIFVVVLFTSERNGPGSQLLTATAPITTSENAANTPDSDLDAIAQTTQPDASRSHTPPFCKAHWTDLLKKCFVEVRRSQC